ncbi:N-acetyltransferase [Aquimarina sp. AD10]|uniref:GNAT family N-acetyltransferase n=1 Tax=Aquimarina sp. AD10 TaxID=1714849 RepID=UPI000E535908|nr:GNAT family N-acetyltransferase [Aquimarina sp. AD10]AXT61616.1 N-acetyltransferase [Aquimarina sp. AD10]RKN01035.1 GNAT family N-acetyltransferase [Aquimarina sp. AD10]
MIFETQKLIVRYLTIQDKDAYFDMMGNPNVMNLVPRPAMSREDSDKHLHCVMNIDHMTSDTKVWAIESKLENDFIGLCAFLKNDANQDEIGYRLREKYWGKGYGTEIAKGLIDYGFYTMNCDIITADVTIDNSRSAKILDKFLYRDKEFFNANDNCNNRRYKIDKISWMKKNK